MIFRLVGHTYMILIHWFIKLNKQSVLKVTTSLCGWDTPQFIGAEATLITQKSFKLIGTVTLSIYSATMLTYMLMSIFVGIATNLQAEEVYIYLFPYWYSCKSDAILCWNVASYWSYLLKNGCQFTLMFVEQLALFNCVTLFVLLILYFEAHKEVLKKRTNELKERTDGVFESYWHQVWNNRSERDQIKSKHGEVFNQGLIQFIKYHQFLRKVFVNAKPLLIGLLSLILCFIWLLMLFTVCFIMVEDSGSLIYKIKVGSLVIMSGVVFYLTCYLGELTSNLNNSFAEFLYDTSWYELTPKSRQLLAIELLLLQNSYRIKAFGMYFINMERFAFSMRSMYTALNMLLISFRKA
ncbi:odorant receptor 2a [Planococcus citri]|uniref:odorant receptor 2a n=1 Tax=Planococcus citri TaxID=170843 RepID=UPI0031F856EC